MKAGVDSTRVVRPLFQAEDGGSIPTSTLQLVFSEVSEDTFERLNRLWHSRLPFVGYGFGVCYGAEHDGVWYATAAWSKPSARMLPQDLWYELRRFAIAADAPKNTASRMLGWMRKDITKRHPEIQRLISYQDLDVHTGTIYKAAGWQHAKDYQTARSNSVGWGNRARSGAAQSNGSPKMRWEYAL